MHEFLLLEIIILINRLFPLASNDLILRYVCNLLKHWLLDLQTNLNECFTNVIKHLLEPIFLPKPLNPMNDLAMVFIMVVFFF